MKQKGFTVIELMVVITFIGILATVILGVATGSKTGDTSYGINGYVETRCINGVTFVVGSNGSVEQVIGSNGTGVSCGQQPVKQDSVGTVFQ